MSKLFECSLIFIVAFILLQTNEMAETVNIISKFTFDISDAGQNTGENKQKISEALEVSGSQEGGARLIRPNQFKSRLAFTSFELKIQLDLLEEFNGIILLFNSVYGDKILNEGSFNEKEFFKNAFWVLFKEIKFLIELIDDQEPNPIRERTYQELDQGPRKYFMKSRNYPLPNDVFTQLKHWMTNQLRLVADDGNYIETVEIDVMRNVFSHNNLAPVMNELKNIMDAPAERGQHQQQNIHPTAGQSVDQQNYFEEKGREAWKKFLVIALNKKDLLLKGRSFDFETKNEFAFTGRQIDAIRWARIRYEIFYMHLNAIWLLLSGIEKYVNYQPEFMEKRSSIKILQMENKYIKDYAMNVEQMKTMATESLQLIKLFLVNLEKGNDDDEGKNGNMYINLNGAKRKKIEEKSDDGNLHLEIVRDHHFINKWVNPKNKINWMALDAANLKAFTDYTGEKFDRRHLGMVLQRQLLTEIGALKIVQNYMENKKHRKKIDDKETENVTYQQGYYGGRNAFF